SEWLALVGDTSDNVPGVSGVGKVTAAKLLREHGSIDGILAAAGGFKGKLKETFADPGELAKLARSRRLVALKRDCPLPVALDELRAGPWDGARLAALLAELEFDALIERLEGRGGPGSRGGGKARASDAELPSDVPAMAPASATPRAEVVTALEVEVELLCDAASLAAFCAAARGQGSLALLAELDGARSD